MATAVVVCFLAAVALITAAAIEDARNRRLRNICTLPLIGIALVLLPLAASLDNQQLGDAAREWRSAPAGDDDAAVSRHLRRTGSPSLCATTEQVSRRDPIDGSAAVPVREW